MEQVNYVWHSLTSVLTWHVKNEDNRPTKRGEKTKRGCVFVRESNPRKVIGEQFVNFENNNNSLNGLKF